MAIVEDYKIGDQVIVLDNLQLIVANIFGDGIGTGSGRTILPSDRQATRFEQEYRAGNSQT